MDNECKQISRITKLRARNYRSIESLDLTLSPLTVLVGPNASGKSNVADLLKFVSDSIRDSLDGALTSRHGADVVHRSPLGQKAPETEVGLAIDLDDAIVEYGFSFRIKTSGEYHVRRELAQVDAPTIGRQTIGIRDGRLVKPSFKRFKQENLDRSVIDDFFRSLVGDDTNVKFPFANLLPTLQLLIMDLPIDNYMEVERAIKKARHFIESVRCYHIFPNTLRDPQKMSARYPLEQHGENLASVLHDMIQRKSAGLQEMMNCLGHIVPGIRDIRVTPAGGYLVIKLLHMEDPGAGKGTWFDVSQESDGTLRLLGLLVALFQDPPPPVIVIEEPELTIHPGALSVLAELMLEATQRTSLLVTTHSPEFIDSLPIECIRAVEMINGVTIVDEVNEQQRRAVSEGLFSPGELHRMEGLQAARTEN